MLIKEKHMDVDSEMVTTRRFVVDDAEKSRFYKNGTNK